MVSQVNESLSFDALYSEDITAVLAARISVELLKSSDYDEEIFNIWSDKLLKKFGLLECTCDVLNIIFPEFYNVIKKVFDSAKDKGFTTSNEQFKCMLNYLNNWITIFNWLEEQTDGLDLYNLSIFIQYGLKSSELFLNSINENPLESENATQSQLHLIISKTALLHKMISNNIKTNVNLFTGKDESCADLLKRILNLLTIHLKYCDEEILQIDLLKIINNILSNNFEFFKKHPEDEELWFRNLITYLCKNIINKIEVVQTQQFSKELEVTLKFGGFYMKCIKNFFDYEIYVCDDLIKIYYLLFRPTPTIVDTNTESLIEQHLKVAALCILDEIYKNDNFINNFLEDLIAANTISSGTMLLSIEILRLLSKENDCRIIANYFNKSFLKVIFSNIAKHKDIFVKKSEYERFLKYSCVLFTRFGSNNKLKEQFFNTLTNGILQDDIILASVSMDIWIFLARLSNPEIRYDHYVFWSELNNRSPKFSNKPSAIYIEEQLRLIYDILPNNYKENIWKEFFNNIDANIRLLLTLGIERITNENKKLFMKNQLQEEICEFSNFKTVKNYYNILEKLAILSKLHITSSTFLEVILNFWKIFFNLNDDMSSSADPFKEVLVEFSIKNFSYFNNFQVNMLINIIEKFLSSSIQSDSIKLCLIRFLRKVQNVASVKKSLSLLENDKNILIRTNLLILKNQTIKINFNEQELVKYITSLQIIEREHKCSRKSSEDFNDIETETGRISAKKIKLEESTVNENELIKKSLKDAYALKQLYTTKAISRNSRSELMKIAKIYNDILCNTT